MHPGSIFTQQPDLLGRFRRGESAALTAIYRAYQPRVVRMLSRGTQLRRAGDLRLVPLYVDPDEAPDLLQEIFLKAFSPAGRRGYDDRRAYEPYLLMIARNTMVDWVRGRQRHRPLGGTAIDKLASDGDPVRPPEPWEDPRALSVAERYVAALPPTLAAIHRHRFVDGLPQSATARRLGLSRQNLRTLERQLCRGLIQALEADRLQNACAARGLDGPL
jgi:RNA polymerase sigma factor (sigma-70 family)